MDLIDLYAMMTRARAVELAQAELWERGLISGEMHLGTGEEAVAAGVVARLQRGDAVALDHRPTAVMNLLGVDLESMLAEMLGREEGLCRGRGGHMHLLDPERLAASGGIVGAAGPLAVGFALSAKRLRPGRVAVAFYGDGASNQGMLLESLNLAVAWSLPLLFVCKDNGWAVTTRSEKVTGGDLRARAAACGLEVDSVDGLDVGGVYEAAGRLLESARGGEGPAFLLARTSRLDGHLCGDPMLKMARRPIAEGGETFGKAISSTLKSGGGSVGARASSMINMLGLLRRARKQRRESKEDPLVRCRKRLKKRAEELARLDEQAEQQVAAAVNAALGEVSA